MTVISKFDKAMTRADRAIAARLNDREGCYTSGDGHRITGLQIMVGRSVERAGVLEIFPAGQLVITVLKEQLTGARVMRGGVFQLDKTKHIVQEPLTDDGAFTSFLCLEGP